MQKHRPGNGPTDLSSSVLNFSCSSVMRAAIEARSPACSRMSFWTPFSSLDKIREMFLFNSLIHRVWVWSLRLWSIRVLLLILPSKEAQDHLDSLRSDLPWDFSDTPVLVAVVRKCFSVLRLHRILEDSSVHVSLSEDMALTWSWGDLQQRVLIFHCLQFLFEILDLVSMTVGIAKKLLFLLFVEIQLLILLTNQIVVMCHHRRCLLFVQIVCQRIQEGFRRWIIRPCQEKSRNRTFQTFIQTSEFIVENHIGRLR